jgi:hypothetical protein
VDCLRSQVLENQVERQLLQTATAPTAVFIISRKPSQDMNPLALLAKHLSGQSQISDWRISLIYGGFLK